MFVIAHKRYAGKYLEYAKNSDTIIWRDLECLCVCLLSFMLGQNFWVQKFPDNVTIAS